MCGRYSLANRLADIAERFGVDPGQAALVPRYNIAPAQEVPVIISGDGFTGWQSRRLAFFRWGLIPSWAKDPSIGHRLINARAETVDQKPSFKDSFRRRRCIIPADGFYEWAGRGKAKKPFRISLKTNDLFAFAGLWDSWTSPTGETVHSCTILTTEANDLVAPIHHRMPVILLPENEEAWLAPDLTDPEILKQLLHPYPPELMQAYEVSPLVNSPRNDLPECIEPVRGLFSQ